MAIIKTYLNYLGYGCGGWHFGFFVIEQAQSKEESKQLGYWSSPKEKHLYGIIEREEDGRKIFDIIKDNYLINISNKGNPLPTIKKDVKKIIASWTINSPRHKVEFKDSLEGKIWDSDIERDKLIAQHDQHQIDTNIQSYLPAYIFQ